MMVVLQRRRQKNSLVEVCFSSIPYPKKNPSRAGYGALEIAILVADRIFGIKERVWVVPICTH
jgi:hypothetical protein